MTLPQITAPIASWAVKSGIKTAVTLVADYGPGIDAETAFKTTFTGGGGQVAESIRVPLRNPEFAPFVQRIKDTKPEAVFIFVPAGEQGIAFMKAYRERGLAEAGIKVIATGDLTDDHVLQVMGDSVLGVITSGHYSVAHDSAENKAFLKSVAEANPDSGRPNFMTVAAYDGMAAIYEVARKLNGNIDGDKAMRILKGMKLVSPRGAIMIDPEPRDIVQTAFIYAKWRKSATSCTTSNSTNSQTVKIRENKRDAAQPAPFRLMVKDGPVQSNCVAQQRKTNARRSKSAKAIPCRPAATATKRRPKPAAAFPGE